VSLACTTTTSANYITLPPTAVALFTGETLVEPGVVQIPYWRPDQPDELGPDAARYPGYAGVARID